MNRDDALFHHLMRRQMLRDLALSRRELLRRGGRGALGLGALALLAACGTSDDATNTAAAGGGTAPAGSGSPAGSPGTAIQLPELTSIPDKFKGEGEVRMVGYGGVTQDTERSSYFEPFERLTGIKVVENEGADVAKVKAMVDSGNVEWDVVEIDRSDVLNLQAKGDYWEEIDYSYVDVDNIDEVYRHKYATGMLPYATIYAYRTDAFNGAKPDGLKDLWDTEKFPGPRSLESGSGGLAPNLEFALLADGVEPDKLYPLDIDRAYDSLSKIKKDVVKWWETGATPAQLLTDNEVYMATAWNGRIATIQKQGAPVDISWKNGLLLTDSWAVPKGAKNKENAMKFIGFTTMAISQARLSLQIPYGFVNNQSAQYLPQEALDALPTAPDIKKNLIPYDSQWWAENRDKVLDKWNEWILS